MIKVKELKDDALLDIKVNKSYYMMAKAASFTILKGMNIPEKENGDEYFKKIMNEKYENLDENQRAFYTVVLLLAEIEKQATENNLFIEKEVLQPGDEGYKEPEITTSEDLD
jgi:menaquinone-dependent protoporphyrinogen IX oxidase